ncbi:hypothetical protein GX586_12825 [bacterium]|nr:hypothetical protein [bacterium]
MQSLWKMLAVPGAVALLCGAAGAVTVVEMQTNVLVRDTIRLGLNMTGNNYYDSPTLVRRDVKNFEGATYRQCHEGTLFTNGFATWRCDSNTYIRSGWSAMMDGGAYRILSGPAQDTTGRIAAVSNIYMMTWNSSQSNVVPFFVFDKPVALPGGLPMRNAGFMVQKFLLGEGNLNGTYGYWLQTNCFLATGDVSPNSWGNGALLMVGSTNTAYVRMCSAGQDIADMNGQFEIKLRAKAAAGAPVLWMNVDYGGFPNTRFTVPGAWSDFVVTATLAGVTGATQPRFLFSVTNGNVLVDDLSVVHLSDPSPIAFRADTVNVLSNMRPGVLRWLQMGGNTLSNTLLPRLFQHAYMDNPDKVGPYGSAQYETYGMHEFLELCETLGCESWYVLPGALDPWEMSDLMEYLGAPATTGFGRVRAALGHPEPWTKTLPRINVELGNEIWNAAGYWWCGYKGPNYWSNMFAIGKASLYYTNTVIFHSAGQNFSSSMASQVLRDAPTADRYSIAPYVLSSLTTNDLALNNTDDRFYRWLFGYPLHTTYVNGMPQHYAVMTNRACEYSVYEFNHHTTGGSASYNDVNRFVSTIGAGISIGNTMLALLKQYGIRTQCMFNFTQGNFDAYSLGTPGRVWLWGTVLNTKKGSERYRPTALAFTVANRVIGGDLVRTAHSGDNPAFDANGYFRGESGVKTYTFATLHTYAFRDGMRRGLVIVNFDVSSNRTVEVRLPAGEGVAGGTATTWYTVSSHVTNHNEGTNPPRVAMAQETLAPFTNGAHTVITPYTIQSIEWFAATNPQNASVLINGGAPVAFESNAVLSLHAENPDPVQMQVADNALFTGAEWTEYAGTMPWVLRIAQGTNMVYARFRAAGGGESAVAGAAIYLVPEPAALLFCAAAGLAGARRRGAA